MNKVRRELYRLKEQKYLWAALLVGIAGLFASHYCLASHQTSREIIRDVGIAGLVGAYLSMTIDRVNRIRIHEEVDDYIHTVGSNFIKAVYGNDQPLRLFDVIRKTLFDCRFIRTEYVADLSLHDFSQAYIDSAPAEERALLQQFHDNSMKANAIAKYVILKAFTRFKVTNVSKATAEYAVVWEITKPFGGNFKGLCGVTSVLINGQEQVPAAGYYENPESATDPLLKFRKSVSVEAGKEVIVEMESYSVRLPDDSEPWQTLIPCNGLSVTVTDANGNKDIHLLLDAPVVEQTAVVAVKNPKTNKASLHVGQYLLPYQGVLIKWTPTTK